MIQFGYSNPTSRSSNPSFSKLREKYMEGFNKNVFPFVVFVEECDRNAIRAVCVHLVASHWICKMYNNAFIVDNPIKSWISKTTKLIINNIDYIDVPNSTNPDIMELREKYCKSFYSEATPFAIYIKEGQEQAMINVCDHLENKGWICKIYQDGFVVHDPKKNGFVVDLSVSK